MAPPGPKKKPTVAISNGRSSRSGSVAADPALMQSFQAHIEDMRNLIMCKVCIQPLYEPYTLGCGHTFCYNCLSTWFGAARVRKTCPDCRANVRAQPSPAYLLRDMVHMFVGRVELLPENETIAEHEEAKREGVQEIERDRADTSANGGLFRGAFKSHHSTEGLNGPILDQNDGVLRCPRCTWELEGGFCNNCGWADPDHPDYESTDEESTDYSEDVPLDEQDAELGDFGDQDMEDIDDYEFGPDGDIHYMGFHRLIRHGNRRRPGFPAFENGEEFDPDRYQAVIPFSPAPISTSPLPHAPGDTDLPTSVAGSGWDSEGTDTAVPYDDSVMADEEMAGFIDDDGDTITTDVTGAAMSPHTHTTGSSIDCEDDSDEETSTSDEDSDSSSGAEAEVETPAPEPRLRERQSNNGTGSSHHYTRRPRNVRVVEDNSADEASSVLTEEPPAQRARKSRRTEGASAPNAITIEDSDDSSDGPIAPSRRRAANRGHGRPRQTQNSRCDGTASNYSSSRARPRSAALPTTRSILDYFSSSRSLSVLIAGSSSQAP